MDQGLVTIIVAVAGAAGTVLSFLAGRRERVASAIHKEASAAALISEGYLNLVASLEQRVNELEKTNDSQARRMDKILAENRSLRNENTILARRVAQLEEEVVQLKNGNGRQLD